MQIFTKFIDKNANKEEIELQTYISNKYNFCPKIYNCIYTQRGIQIIMEKIEGKTLYEKYSDQACDIPESIWKSIHNIINILYYQEGIEYIDISPYNFIVKDEKVYIIDFGHAYWTGKDKNIQNWFLKKFILEEINEFNPDFI